MKTQENSFLNDMDDDLEKNYENENLNNSPDPDDDDFDEDELDDDDDLEDNDLIESGDEDLSDDDDDTFVKDTDKGDGVNESFEVHPDFEKRDHGRTSGRMIDHEPGTPGI